MPTTGTIKEILNLTDKQQKDLDADYDLGCSILEQGFAGFEATCRLISEPKVMYLELIFGWENSSACLLRFRELTKEQFDTINAELAQKNSSLN